MKVIPSARKAQLVDYILLGWQSSTYTLKNSNHNWFMKPYSEIIEETGIPKSTLERYIKELHDEGFIERRQALYSRTTEHGFEVKKGNYIHITDKLLALISPSKSVTATTKENTTDIPNNSNLHYPQDNKLPDNIKPECKKIDIKEGIEPLKMRGLYISDLYHSFFINNIICKKPISVDKITLERLSKQFESIQSFLYTEIKEEIPNDVKKLVLGTFFNLTFEHKKHLSSPKQLAAEYMFALLNTEFYVPHVTCFKHRNNILAKMIRGNRWCTPKGFYKHFYLGQDFKDQQELRESRANAQKNNVMNPYHDTNEGFNAKQEEHKDIRLIHIEEQMVEQSMLLETLTQNLYQQSSEELIAIHRVRIQEVRTTLEHLWQQQLVIEQEQVAHSHSTIKYCA